MLHKFRVQYILIDFSDNGFLVFFQRILFRFSIWSVVSDGWRNCGVLSDAQNVGRRTSFVEGFISSLGSELINLDKISQLKIVNRI